MTTVTPLLGSERPRRGIRFWRLTGEGAPSLARSGMALVLSSLIASVLGMVFWAVAARQLTAEQVGAGAALITALTTLSHAAQLNLRNLVHRFVPGTGPRGRKLVLQAYAVAASAALLLGAGFVFLSASLAPELAFLQTTPWMSAGFVLCLLVWTLYALQEAALTALRLAAVVPVQSLVYSLFKIALLLVLTSTLSGSVAVLAAWVLPAAIVGLTTHIYAANRANADHSAPRSTSGFSWRLALNFFGWDYVGTLSTTIALAAAPMVVLNMAGAAELARYYLASSIAYLLYLAGRHFGAAMLTEVASYPERRRSLYAEMLLLCLVPVTVGAAAIIIAAPLIMAIFGTDYAAEGANTLAMLALASIPGAAVTAYLGICRAENRVVEIATAQVGTLLVVMLLGVALTSKMGAFGMAMAWLAANVLVMGAAIAWESRHSATIPTAIDLMSAAVRLRFALLRLLPSRPTGATEPALLTFIERPWRVLRTLSSLSDAQTVFLSDPASAERAYLKSATSAAGRRALIGEYYTMQSLRQSDYVATLMPPVLHFENGRNAVRLLVAEVPGTEGRSLVSKAPLRGRAAALALDAAAALHASTPIVTRIDRPWLARWVDEPLSKIPGGSLIGESLRTGLVRMQPRLGLHHGDFCPDNIIYRMASDGQPLVVSGILDWGNARIDGPAGLDSVAYLIALRAEAAHLQLGQVVSEWMSTPALTENERTSFHTGPGLPAWAEDPYALRTLVLLAWLHHVSNNMEKSERYTSNWFWNWANVTHVVRAHEHV